MKVPWVKGYENMESPPAPEMRRKAAAAQLHVDSESLAQTPN